MKSTAPVKVFISYTHDSSDHDALVLELSNALRSRAGIDCDIDQYHANENWPLWMEKRLEWADRVLVVCTETYLRRWKNEEVPGRGLGAQWESLLTRQELYENPGKIEKFIPLAFQESDLPFIPTPLRNVTRVVLGASMAGFNSLLNRIHGIPPSEKPPINTSLAPIPCADGFFASPEHRGSCIDLSPHSLGLHEEPEEMFTNLFPVNFPERIYQARSRVKNAKVFLQEFRKVWKASGYSGSAPIDFWCERGTVFSFSAFDSPIWRELIKAREIHPKGFFPADSWAQSENHADRNRFIKLLNRSLDHLCENNGTQFRITRSSEMDCHLFARKNDLLEGKVSTLAIRSQAPRTVFKAIPDKTSDNPDAIQHWKHVAFRHRFVRFGQSWHMVLTPFWAFTSDGIFKASRWQKKSSFNMQKPEKNRAVLGHVAFWASVLCRDDDLLNGELGFCIRRPPTLKVTPSVYDQDWVGVADDRDKQEFAAEEGILL
ncbi:MAG: TIR domain-containing protein [Verrucomicrobiae bacterium]|nr:TIR domain-containing protein [Verrucomicrobiae bacterium]